MKAYKRSRGVNPPILNFGTRWKLAVNFRHDHLTPGKETRCLLHGRPSGHQSRCVRSWGREKSLVLTRIRTPKLPARSELIHGLSYTSPLSLHTGLFISPSGTSELDCATTKKDRAERSILIGRESLKVFFCTRGLGVLAASTARG